MLKNSYGIYHHTVCLYNHVLVLIILHVLPPFSLTASQETWFLLGKTTYRYYLYICHTNLKNITINCLKRRKKNDKNKLDFLTSSFVLNRYKLYLRKRYLCWLFWCIILLDSNYTDLV